MPVYIQQEARWASVAGRRLLTLTKREKRMAEALRVGAVFHRNASHLENAHQIYGHAYVRIQKASQLAQGVGDLLLTLLREVGND